MTQVIGLSTRAESFLARGHTQYEEKVTRRYEDGTVEESNRSGSAIRQREVGEFEGMFGEPHPLNAYEIEGRWYEEYVQADPWASGPCVFLALKDEAGEPLEELLWSDDEISANL
jgi:hypothetical protein